MDFFGVSGPLVKRRVRGYTGTRVRVYTFTRTTTLKSNRVHFQGRPVYATSCRGVSRTGEIIVRFANSPVRRRRRRSRNTIRVFPGVPESSIPNGFSS